VILQTPVPIAKLDAFKKGVSPRTQSSCGVLAKPFEA